MSVKDSPEVLDLFARIATLVPDATAFDGTVVRSVGTRYANEDDFLSGKGAARVGGRWNRRRIRAVYASLDILTATHEAYQNLLSAGFSLSAIRPRVIAGAKVTLSAVLDLTDKGVRRRLGFTLRELVDENWLAIQEAGEEAWTQAIGRGCRRAGLEGLLVPSARVAGKNIVIFPDRLRPESVLSAVAAKDLPPHPSQWPT